MIIMEKTIDKYFYGYIDAFQKEDYFCFYRFSEKQRDFYQNLSAFFGSRSRFQSGVYILAEECSEISFDFKVFENSSENIRFDIVIDDEEESVIFDSEEGSFSKKFSKSRVMLYLPYYAEIGLKNIYIDGKAEEKNFGKLLCFGDSITQGFFSDKSSNGFPQIIGRSLGLEAYNFGIGGVCLKSGIMGDIELLPKPEIITFAYGTNDWNFENPFEEEMDYIFDVISKKFPGVPVFVILPAARKTQDDVKVSGTLEDVRKIIEEKAKTYDNFYVLGCGRKIQSERDLSSDGIHPHTEGMDFYADMILDEIKSVLNK